MIVATLLILTAAFLSVAFPLATYTLTLASFGLAHVFTELRYVNSRFNQRLNIDLRKKIVILPKKYSESSKEKRKSIKTAGFHWEHVK